VTPDYLRVMGIPLRQGRFFTERDRIGNEPVIAIDEVLATRAFAGREAVGNRLWVQFLGPARVVGVVIRSGQRIGPKLIRFSEDLVGSIPTGMILSRKRRSTGPRPRQSAQRSRRAPYEFQELVA
jgi:hypothetical protein